MKSIVAIFVGVLAGLGGCMVVPVSPGYHAGPKVYAAPPVYFDPPAYSIPYVRFGIYGGGRGDGRGHGHH